MVVGDIWVCYMCVSPPHLSLWSLCLVCVLCGGTAVVPPDQRGTEPLHLTQVDQKGTVWTVHTVEGIAGVGGPTCTHPLGEKHGNINLKTLQKLDVQYHFVRTCYYAHTHTHTYTLTSTFPGHSGKRGSLGTSHWLDVPSLTAVKQDVKCWKKRKKKSLA